MYFALNMFVVSLFCSTCSDTLYSSVMCLSWVLGLMAIISAAVCGIYIVCECDWIRLFPAADTAITRAKIKWAARILLLGPFAPYVLISVVPFVASYWMWRGLCSVFALAEVPVPRFYRSGEVSAESGTLSVPK